MSNILDYYNKNQFNKTGSFDLIGEIAKLFSLGFGSARVDTRKDIYRILATAAAFPIVSKALGSWLMYADPEVIPSVQRSKSISLDIPVDKKDKKPKKIASSNSTHESGMKKHADIVDLITRVSEAVYRHPFLAFLSVVTPTLGGIAIDPVFKELRNRYTKSMTKETKQLYGNEVQETLALGDLINKNKLNKETLNQLTTEQKNKLVQKLYRITGKDYSQIFDNQNQVKEGSLITLPLELLFLGPLMHVSQKVKSDIVNYPLFASQQATGKAVSTWYNERSPETYYDQLVPSPEFFRVVENRTRQNPEAVLKDVVDVEEPETEQEKIQNEKDDELQKTIDSIQRRRKKMEDDLLDDVPTEKTKKKKVTIIKRTDT